MRVENPSYPAHADAPLRPLEAPGREFLARVWAQERTGFVLLSVAIVAFLLVGFTLGDRILHNEKVMPGVTAGGVDISGMSEADALAAVQTRADELASQPITVQAGKQALSVDPSALGLTVNAAATVRAAREAGRSGDVLAQMSGTVLRRFRNEDVALVLEFDEGRFQGVLDGWVAATGKGLVDGGLTIQGTTVVEIAPKSGIGIQRNVARAKVIGALEHGTSDAGTLTIGATTPAIDARDVARAARRARAILAAPVTVTVGVTPMTLTPEQVAPTIETSIIDSQLVLNANPDKLRAVFGPALGAVEIAPQDANFAINGTAVSVIPAVTGQLVDLDGVGREIAKNHHAFTAPLRVVEPGRSTEWAQKLNITELVSSYTTRHPCCAPRVTNIHKGADTINNTIIEPGQTFSLNGALGERTLDKGYVSAPQIGADLSYEDSVGGGVSQLSTTLYNAVFFGCYQDVTHTVHALYISRYPMGREATLNYPSIDNKFRNDSASGILMKTFYSGGSVTVALYGNKEGRTCGEEGPNIISTEPPGVKYVDNPAVPIGTQKVLDPGHTGYVVENFRIINKPGQPEKRERYVEHYSMTPQTIERGTGPAPPPPAAPPAPPPAPAA